MKAFGVCAAIKRTASMATVEKNLRFLNIVILHRKKTIRIGWKWIFYLAKKKG